MQMPQNLLVKEYRLISRKTLWNNMLKYAFIASPHGNGLDCHRTWEALVLGCIPIVKKSPLDGLYEGLPVLIVNEWSDINEQLLKDKIEEFKNKQFNMDKLKLEYWINKIKAAGDNIQVGGDEIYNKNQNSNIIDLSQFENKIYSQNGEDGITMKLVELIYGNDNINKYYVEFGVEDGNECNTRILREQYKWNGLLMDGSHENNDINLKKEFIYKDNVIELFKKYNVPTHINLLCVDTDYNDFYLLNEIFKKYTCDIIICEYNASLLPTEDKIIIYEKNSMWNGTNYFGASLLSLKQLGEKSMTGFMLLGLTLDYIESINN